MVLQRAPARANVWGYVENCEDVSVEFNDMTIKASMIKGWEEGREQMVYLPLCLCLSFLL